MRLRGDVMKVEIGEVTRVSGGDFSVEFHVPVDTKIPNGARVIVEWDDNVHQCHDLTKRGRFSIRLEPGGWFLCSGDGPDDWRWIVVVDYCPGCGKKLEV